MNPRQLAALTAPFEDARDHRKLAARRTVRERGDRLLVVVVLAVDR